MDRKTIQQLAVFAAIFLLLQIGFDWMQGVPITPGVFLSRLLATLVATAVYGGLMHWLNIRKNRGD